MAELIWTEPHLAEKSYTGEVEPGTSAAIALFEVS